MELSTDRILTTHVGSLPRSKVISDGVFAIENGELIDEDIVYAKLGTMAEGASELAAVCLDAEHAPFGRLELDACVQALRAACLSIAIVSGVLNQSLEEKQEQHHRRKGDQQAVARFVNLARNDVPAVLLFGASLASEYFGLAGNRILGIVRLHAVEKPARDQRHDDTDDNADCTVPGPGHVGTGCHPGHGGECGGRAHQKTLFRRLFRKEPQREHRELRADEE